MIYTIGYEKLDILDVSTVLDALDDARLVDVRSRPYGRVKRGWGRTQLTEALGERYEHRGDLGGFGSGPTIEALRKLAKDAKGGSDLVLMCQEDFPADCHRHHLIALPLWDRYKVEARHLWRQPSGLWEIFSAAEYEAEMNATGSYTVAITWEP